MHNKSLHFVCRLGACACEVVGAIRGSYEALQLQGRRGGRSVFGQFCLHCLQGQLLLCTTLDLLLCSIHVDLRVRGQVLQGLGGEFPVTQLFQLCCTNSSCSWWTSLTASAAVPEVGAPAFFHKPCTLRTNVHGRLYWLVLFTNN